MLDLVVFYIMIVFFFWSKKYGEQSETPAQEAYLAMLFYGAYIALLLFGPPFPKYRSIYLGQLYGYIPMLSFGAILFPHFNTKFFQIVTRVLGWLGLVIVTLILLYFKFLIW